MNFFACFYHVHVFEKVYVCAFCCFLKLVTLLILFCYFLRDAAGSGAPLKGAPDPAATGTYIYIYIYIFINIRIYVYVPVVAGSGAPMRGAPDPAASRRK